MILESADIKFACSQCGQRIVVDKSAAGMDGTCPICEGPVTVPFESSVSERTVGMEITNGAYADPGLQDTRTELFASTVEWGRVQRELDEANEEIARLNSLFKKAVDECERITASATHAQAEIKSFQADRQQLKADLSAAKQRALAAENQVAELATALAAANHEQTELRQQFSDNWALEQERISAVETQLGLREHELEGIRAENSEIVQSLAGTQADLARRDNELNAVRAELETAQGLLNEAADIEESLLVTKNELIARLDAVTAESLQLREERDSLQQQAQVLRQDLVKTDVGAELLELRARLDDLTQDRASIADTLAEKRAEVNALTATEQTLRGELEEARRCREEAERQAAANSESQMNKDNDVLRGIVARQNTTLGVYYSEVRRMRRARYTLRLVYWLFAIALLGLVAFAISVFTHQGVGDFFNKAIH
jgi:DNA repair exonuclease SbcCD ATPase subunit